MIDRRDGPPRQGCRSTALAVNLLPEDRSSLAGILRGSNWTTEEVQTCQGALVAARKGTAPVLLCGTRMPDGDWRMLLEGLGGLESPPALIVISRLADECLWAEVLSAGGYDVLLTPFDANEVERVLGLARSASLRNQAGAIERAKRTAGETGAVSGLARLHAATGHH